MLYLLWSYGGPPTKCLSRSELGHQIACLVGLIVPEILRLMNFGVLAWNCLFTPLFVEFFGHIFRIWRHSLSWPRKGPSLGGNTSFELFSVRICASVRPGRRMEKKGQDNKKSQKCYISPIWGEAPTGPIRPKSWMVGDVHDVITCAKFKTEIFMGYNFTGGRIFNFPINFAWALQPCSAKLNALPVISMPLECWAACRPAAHSLTCRTISLASRSSPVDEVGRKFFQVDQFIGRSTSRSCQSTQRLPINLAITNRLRSAPYNSPFGRIRHYCSHDVRPL